MFHFVVYFIIYQKTQTIHTLQISNLHLLFTLSSYEMKESPILIYLSKTSIISHSTISNQMHPLNKQLSCDPWTNRTANIQLRRTKTRSKRGIKLEIERNDNHRRRDGRFGHVCAFNIYLYSGRIQSWSGSRADTARSKVDGLGSKVVYLA